MRINLKSKRVFALLFVAFFLSVSFLVFADQKDETTIILGSSQNKEVSLGLSGEEIDKSTEIPVEEEEPVYYQFKQEKDTVTLALAGDVSKIVMIEPEGEKEDRIVLGASTLVLGSSAKKTSTPEIKTFFQISLGESGKKPEEKAIETDNEEFFNKAVKTDFAMGEDGDYGFALYNSMDELITTLDYPFLRLGKGEVGISYIDGATNIDFLDKTVIKVDYNPIAGVTDDLYVYIPPYFEILEMPSNTTGVSYTRTYPGEKGKKFYEDAINGQKFIGAIESMSPNNNYSWGTVFQYGVNAKIDPTVDQSMSFSLTIQRSRSVKDKESLGNIIFKMGTDLKNMPMLTVVEKGLNGGVANSTILYGNTLFEENPQPLLLKNPTVNTTNFLQYNPPTVQGYLWERTSLISGPIYPMGDVSYLLRYFDGMEIKPGSIPFVHADGHTYVEQWSSPASSFQTSLITIDGNKEPSLNDAGNGVVWNLKPSTYFKGGEFIDFGTTYIRYTQYGIPQEKEFYKIDPKYNITIPKHDTNIYSTFYSRLDPKADYQATDTARRIKQGLTFESIYASLNNSFTMNGLPSVYLDATYHVKFPYEISPESVRLVYTQKGTKPKENTMETHPTGLRYKVHGSDVEFPVTVALSDSVINIPTTNGRVSDVFIDYETIYANNTREYHFTTNVSKIDINGVSLNTEHEVFVETNVITKDGNRIEGYTSDTPKKVAIGENEKTKNRIILEGEGEDSIVFGTITARSGTLLYPYDKSIIDTANLAPTYYTGSTLSGSVTADSRSSPWYFGFNKLVDINKNYDSLTIEITPKTENDKKALSKVIGVTGSSYPGSYPSISLEYTTNLVATPRNFISNNYNLKLILNPGEYLTGLKIHTKEINGGKLYKNMFQTSGELLQTPNITSADKFALVFEDSHYYFNGSLDQVAVKENDTFQLVATASMVNDGRYITPGNPEFKNNTSTGTIAFRDYTEVQANLNTSNMTVSYTGGGVGYLGKTIGFTILRPVRLYQTNVSTGSPLKVKTSGGDGIDDHFKNAGTRLYLEVKNVLDVLSVTGYTQESVVDIPANSSKLYTFKINDPYEIKEQQTTVSLYIRPNTSIGTHDGVLGFGISFEDLIGRQTPETGTDAYYHNEPYFKMSYTGATPFPAHWNIPVASGKGTIYMDYSANKITVNHAQVDGIEVIPGAGGSFVLDHVLFKEHQKNPLAIRGSVTNSSTVSMDSYTMRMELPRADGKTENAIGELLNNEFSMFLTSPLHFPDRPDAVIVYYDSSHGVITGIDKNSTLEEFAKVKYVEVTVANFSGNTSLGFDAEFVTDKTKRGKETADISTYIGFSSKKTVAGGETSFVYSHPAMYTYESYLFSNFFGIDSNHVGGVSTSPSRTLEITLLGKAEDGSDVIIYQDTPLSYVSSIKTNLDAYKIIVKSKEPAQYALTLPNMPTVTSPDSRSKFPSPNFPNDFGGEMLIDKQHIILGTNYQYNAGFIGKMMITLPDIALKKGDTATAVPSIKFVNGSNVSTTIINAATKVYKPTADPTVATIDASGLATGVGNGETTYTYTFTTPVGYSVTVIGKIIVAPPTSDFDVTVNIKNVWLPHGSPYVFVKAEGVSTTNLGREYYKLVKLDGGTSTVAHLNTANAAASKTVTMTRVINGDYKISVVPASRFMFLSESERTETIDGSGKAFTFMLEQTRLTYLSDTEKGIMTFAII